MTNSGLVKRVGLTAAVLAVISLALSLTYLGLGYFNVGQNCVETSLLIFTSLCFVAVPLLVVSLVAVFGKQNQKGMIQATLIFTVVLFVFQLVRTMLFAVYAPFEGELAMLGADMAVVIALAAVIGMLFKALGRKTTSIFSLFGLMGATMLTVGLTARNIFANSNKGESIVINLDPTMLDKAATLSIVVAAIGAFLLVAVTAMIAMMFFCPKLRERIKAIRNNVIVPVLSAVVLAAVALKAVILNEILSPFNWTETDIRFRLDDILPMVVIYGVLIVAGLALVGYSTYKMIKCCRGSCAGKVEKTAPVAVEAAPVAPEPVKVEEKKPAAKPAATKTTTAAKKPTTRK